jgi:hypothetical protein
VKRLPRRDAPPARPRSAHARALRSRVAMEVAKVKRYHTDKTRARDQFVDIWFCPRMEGLRVFRSCPIRLRLLVWILDRGERQGGRMGLFLFFRRSHLTPTKVHAVPLQLTSARVRSSPTLSHVHVRGCGPESDATCLTCCLSACSCSFMPRDGIASKMRTILYGRQLGVSWCTSRVHCDAGLNHSPACRPPASRFAAWHAT